MPKSRLVKTRGIVFKSFKYGETSLIVDIYTEERGLRRYIVSGVRKRKARFSAGLLQTMSLIDLVAYDREDRDLNRISEIRPAYLYQSVPFHLKKGAIGLFMIELSRKSIRESEENRPLFDFLFEGFRFLDQTDKAVANIHLHFMIELSAYLGFMPGGDYSEDKPYFDLEEGIFADNAPTHSNYLEARYSQLLWALQNTSVGEVHQLQFNRKERQRMLTYLIDYYRLHIENFPLIHTHSVLKEVLGE